MYYTDNPLLQKCINFSLLVIQYVECLEDQKKFVVSKQLLRAATGIGANAAETQSAESKADFIHKLKIADKEARETMYWLSLCQSAESYPNHTRPLPLLQEIMKILNSIIASTKANHTNQPSAA